jgi:serine protease
MPDMPTTCGANFAGGGTLDGVSIVAGHEFEETVTDPQPSTGWVDSSGQENGDKCAWLTSGPGHTQLINFSGTNFAVQGLWSNAISNCDI